jgi:hypothetical protein
MRSVNSFDERVQLTLAEFAATPRVLAGHALRM